MDIIKKIKGKSKEEKEIEREIRYRKAVASINRYIQKLEKVQQMVYDQGKQASKIGDDGFVRRQAVKYMAIGERIKKGQRLYLLMEEARLQRDLVKISGDFVVFAQDITASILEGPDVDKITSMQADFQKALVQADKIDETLSMAVDIASESIITSGELDQNSIDSIVSSMQGDAIQEEPGLDERIAKGVREIEEQMKQG